MIVGCYTHIWDTPQQLGSYGQADIAAGSGLSGSAKTGKMPVLPEQPIAGVQRHLAAAEPIDVSIVLGFVSDHLDTDIPNATVSQYVKNHPTKLIGFAGIDPSRGKEAIDELDTVRRELCMSGITVAPAAQNFHPADSQAMLLYAQAAEAHLPILFDTGICIGPKTHLDYARPVLLDEVARELPQLRILIAHMGEPWFAETALLLAKHEHVYAEISRITQQPWQAYQALVTAHEYGVMDKLLFGSGFPFANPADCIEDLFSINQFCHGTPLPIVPRDGLRSIVHRNALEILGIAKPAPRSAPVQQDVPVEDEV